MLYAGTKGTVAATKTYTSELAAVALLSGTVDAEATIDRVLAELPSYVELMLGQSEDIAEWPSICLR